MAASRGLAGAFGPGPGHGLQQGQARVITEQPAAEGVEQGQVTFCGWGFVLDQHRAGEVDVEAVIGREVDAQVETVRPPWCQTLRCSGEG